MTPLESMARALAKSFARDSTPEGQATYIEKYWTKHVNCAREGLLAIRHMAPDVVDEILRGTT